jgi:PelA/Pel-15E family pectate lyase
VYQRRSGGWPKNVEMARAMTPTERATVTDEKDLNDSTIDNSSTYPQLRYLARVFEATGDERYRAAFVAGLDYLFAAQYPSGGWPQYYPLRENYSRHITFNDNAMIGVMSLLRDISGGQAPFRFVDQARRAKAAASIDRGLRVILRSQIRVGGRLTAWCAQVDAVTLEPRGARTYEHPSISGKESVDIVRYLMDIERPGPEVVAAIESAVAFYRDNQVKGLRLVQKPDSTLPHGRDVVAEADPNAPPLWARFYEIGTNRPIYSGRDGIVKYRLAEIEVERRAGYSWLGPYAAELLEKDYPAWRRRLK